MAVIHVNGVLKARKHEKSASLTASTGFTSTNYDVTNVVGSNYFKTVYAEEVVVTIESNDVRWTVDGTTPTVTAGTALGHLASAGDVLTITGYENIKNFSAINAVAGSAATFRATFFFRQ